MVEVLHPPAFVLEKIRYVLARPHPISDDLLPKAISSIPLHLKLEVSYEWV